MIASSEGSAVPEPKSVAVGELWDARRFRLFNALARQSPLFADMYRRGIDALNERPLTPGAIIIAGHCFRDLANGLPDVMTDVGEMPRYADTSTPAQALTKVWETHEARLGPINTPIRPDSAPQDPDPVMAVPVVMVEAARRVVQVTSTATENRRRRRSALVLGRQETRRDATVELFHSSVRIFENVRHPQRGREFELEKTIAKIDMALPVIESALEARLGDIFESVESMLDVISAANQRKEGSEQ